MQITESSSSSLLQVLQVDHLSEYVIGYPVYVVITLRSRSDTAFNRLVFADLLDLRGCIGAEITLPNGRMSTKHIPKVVIDPDYGLSGAPLGPGESRRMLSDVSPLFDVPMSEGEYRVRFLYASPDAIYAAPVVKMRFRKPTAAEASTLSKLAPDRTKSPNWGIWTTTRPNEPVYEGALQPNNPLVLNLLLRRLFYGRQPANKIDPSVLDPLGGIYAPEGKALKAEIYRARGDQQNYEQLKAQILTDTPGLLWWIRMLDQGGGYITTFRPSVR